MKKFIFSLLVLLSMAVAASAQGIWHEGLGTAPTGSVTIDSGSTTFAIIAANAPANADLGEIFSGIYHSLRDASIDWCFITGIMQDGNGITLTFSATANDASFSSRSILFGTAYTVIQPRQNAGGIGPGPGGIVIHYRSEAFTYDASGNRTGSTVNSQ